MESLDGLASLTLLPHRQAFVVKFLCEVKYALPKVKKKQINVSSMQIKYVGFKGQFKGHQNGQSNGWAIFQAL